MSKRVVLIAAGLLLAAGSVAAISAPHFRGGGHMRGGFDGPRGFMLGERGDGRVTDADLPPMMRGRGLLK